MTWLLFLAGTVFGGMLGMVVMALFCVSGRESEEERLRAAVRRARVEGYGRGRRSMKREVERLSERRSA